MPIRLSTFPVRAFLLPRQTMRAKLILPAITFLLAFPAVALPPDAAALKATRDQKISDLNAAYVRALEKVKARAMANGNRSGVTEIEKEIDAATTPPLKDSLISGTWVYSVPKGQSISLKFLNDDTAIDTKTSKVFWKNWKVVGESLIVTFADGNTCTFAFNGARDGAIPGVTRNGLNRTLRPKLDSVR